MINPEIIDKVQRLLLAEEEELDAAGLKPGVKERILRLREIYFYWIRNPKLNAGASPKEVSAARRFISGNKQKLAVLKETEPEQYEALREKMQARVDLLIKSGLWFKQAFIEELAALGITFN